MLGSLASHVENLRKVGIEKFKISRAHFKDDEKFEKVSGNEVTEQKSLLQPLEFFRGLERRLRTCEASVVNLWNDVDARIPRSLFENRRSSLG